VITGTPGVPTSTVKAGAGSSVRYCVTEYAPNGRVVVRDERTGSAAVIHTNNRGSGCTGLARAVRCGAAERVVATGTGADGSPATSTATLGPRAAAGCGGSGEGGSSSASSDAGQMSGGDALLLGVAGAVLVLLAIVGALAMRRRRVVPPT
jgi:hypothetical protein